MKEYILNIQLKNWKNQLWFMNSNDSETERKWQQAIKEINVLKDSYEDPIKLQEMAIEYLKSLGFIRIQK